jgi:hypothetical protein
VIGHKSRDYQNKFRQNGGQNGGNQVNSNNGAYCTYCRRPGHSKINCFKLKNKNNPNSTTSNYQNQDQQNFNSNDVAFATALTKNNFVSEIWICDSGACGHYCRSVEGLIDVMDIDEAIMIGNGESMRATKVGNLKFEVVQVNGKKFPVTLHDVKFVPDLCVNLFSLNRALQNGFKLSNENVSIRLSKGSVTLVFDRIIKTMNDFVTGVNMKTLLPKAIYNGMVNTTISEAYDINYLHKAFGHCGLETLKNTARMYGFKFTSQFEVCEDCAIAKARQKNINKA